MCTLDIALVLSPGNKAQTCKDGTLYVVCEYPGEKLEGEVYPIQGYTHQLFAIRDKEVYTRALYTTGIGKYYTDFIKDLHAHGLSQDAQVWHPIGYTAIAREEQDMTGYALSIGYLSGACYKGSTNDAWQELVKCVETLRTQPERIVTEARRLDAPEQCEQGCCTLLALAQAYQNHDATLVIHHDERTVDQYASGDRTVKEHVRRAFCRLVLEDMHRLGIEINLKVY